MNVNHYMYVINRVYLPMREKKVIDVTARLSHAFVIICDAIYLVYVTVPKSNLDNFGDI